MKICMLSAEAIREVWDMGEGIEAMKRAFASLSAGEAQMPLRGNLEISKHNGLALVMPGYLPMDDEMAVKVVSVFNDNPNQGLPLIHALVIVIDAMTGTPMAVMDGTLLTALRTGAGSGAATDLLARKDISKVGIIGAGVQGRTQLEAVCAVRVIQEAWIFDIDSKQADRFASEMGNLLSMRIQVAGNAQEAVENADVICTATTSSRPVFDDEYVMDGAHINAVGAYTPQMQEVPTETVVRSKVVVDHREASFAEAGDLLIPMHEGVFGEDDVFAELGEIAAGIKPGRESPEEISLFKSVGVAVQDVAAANLVLQTAEDLDLGLEFEL